MARSTKVPAFVRWANVAVIGLLRAGVKLSGPGHSPMYLLTVRGRKSGQPRTTPIAILQQDGNRYVLTPYGVVDWVRNLRSAGEATLTRGRRAEEIRALELSASEGGRVLKRFVGSGNPFSRFFGVDPKTSPEDLERVAGLHPVFLLQSASAVPEEIGQAALQVPAGHTG